MHIIGNWCQQVANCLTLPCLIQINVLHGKPRPHYITVNQNIRVPLTKSLSNECAYIIIKYVLRATTQNPTPYAHTQYNKSPGPNDTWMCYLYGCRRIYGSTVQRYDGISCCWPHPFTVLIHGGEGSSNMTLTVLALYE